MPFATAAGIKTHYEVLGSGPPLLMLAPGGFDAKAQNWSTLGIYSELRFLEHLPTSFTCVVFDRREAGESGGRVELITWSDYAAQAKGLIDHLGMDRVYLLGGCAGCSVALALAAGFPEAVAGAALFWPAGGARYRLRQQARFARHLSFVEENGLDAVVSMAQAGDGGFGSDARLGPWASVIRSNETFASSYRDLDSSRYGTLVSGMCRSLFDRDTVPGAEPEALMALDVPTLVVPGHDESHATSAARYLEECLPAADYWDIAVEDQPAANVPGRVAQFLAALQL